MNYLSFLLFLFVINLSIGQSIIGEWETYDDETGDKTSVVEIFNRNGKYYGKIAHLYKDALDSVCDKCEGEKLNKPIIGLVIIENLVKDDDEYNNGSILDPKNGKTYKCYITLESENKLKLRGYIGFSLLGRTQYWQRKL